MITDLKDHPKVVGVKQTQRALAEGTVRLVFLAEDADPRVTTPIEALCKEKGVPMEHTPEMRALGAACGIAVGSAVAALLN